MWWGSSKTPEQRTAPLPPQTPDQRADSLLLQMTQQEKLQMVHRNLTLENSLGPRKAVGWVPAIPQLRIPDLLYADANTVPAARRRKL